MTVHAMRRKDRALPDEAARELLRKGEYGFLATVGADGLPYGVPLSYVLLGDGLYFHSAMEGRKIDNLACCPQVSFTVVGQTRPVYVKNFTTWYESVMAFGTVEKVTDDDEKFRALYALAFKYLPEHMDKAEGDIRHSFARTAVYRLRIESLTGKAKWPRAS
ncbi:MAG TPA: pyridoxamine 5'-phosphate oxidase family protein [Candidatus Avidesulfovibrio excrementigallinarum]|nr:pyridoxamine 5'-phosphate oxidase family protein [Candidatus Avidesulfovibrio excrementigallinarum]